MDFSKLVDFYQYLESIKDILYSAPVFELYELKRKNRWYLIWGTILSSRVKDKILIKVLKKMESLYRSPEDIVNSDVGILEKILKPLGFYKKKARLLIDFNKMLLEKYDGQIPSNLEDLLKLPGVGLKVGSIILNDLYGLKLVGVDVHVHRILNRVGIVNTLRERETWEQLRSFESDIFLNLNRYVVAFGQLICSSKPKCSVCGYRSKCDYAKNYAKNIDKNQ